MTVTAPETALRLQILALLEEEFGSEPNIQISGDKLHDSLGATGPTIGIYPINSQENARNVIELEPLVMVQAFRQWEEKIDPTQVVDPTNIEEWAERLRRRLYVKTAGTEHMWFFRVIRVNYPPDPTGNISRLEAEIRGYTQNPAVVETTG